MRGIWARSTACLVFSSLAFVLGGAQLLAVVELSYGTQTTREWVANGLTVLAVGLFALGVDDVDTGTGADRTADARPAPHVAQLMRVSRSPHSRSRSTNF